MRKYSIRCLFHFVLFSSAALVGCLMCADVSAARAEPRVTVQTHDLRRILNEARALSRSKDYQAALTHYEQALAIQRQLHNPAGEAKTLSKLAATYRKSRQPARALERYQEALKLYRDLERPEEQARTLNNIGVVYRALAQPAEALGAFSEALSIRKRLGDKAGMAKVLVNTGVVQFEQSRYALAVESYTAAMSIFEGLPGVDPGMLATVLSNLGLTYSELGQYSLALGNYQRALAILEHSDDPRAMGTTLHNIGFLYAEQDDNPQALAYYRRALALRTDLDDRVGMASTLNNLGFLLNKQGETDKALGLLERALALAREQQALSLEARSLDSIGDVHVRLQQYPEALTAYQEALTLRRQLEDRRGERITLGNLGKVLQHQERDALAIVFYKQAVNVSEAIRQELSALPRQQRESYASKVSDIYRSLADLLLEQDRVIEAQRVLDLLKLQELEDYLQDVRGNENTRLGIEQLSDGRKIAEQYAELVRRVVKNGQVLRALEKRDDLSAPELERLDALQAEQKAALRAFNRFLDSDEVLAFEERMSRTARRRSVDPAQLNALQDNLRQLPNAVLLYPLVLDERLELLLVTPNAPPIHRPVAVKRQQLNKTVSDFRLALKDRNADPVPLARQLYAWLIEPLQAELAEANARTLIYAPDRVLRYIPLSALHDGDHWLVEKFSINQITAASLTDLDTRPTGELDVLAAAFSTGKYEFEVGEQTMHFSGLPFARAEVDGISNTISNVTRIFDAEFTRVVLEREKNRHSVIHLATHAAFLTGEPRQSFIVLGNGERVTLRDVKDWTMTNVDLVVLSACETGIGGRLGDGNEILGFGYLMQRAGARASIASLWSIDDGGTQILMNAFYELLQDKQLSKAMALQQAQLKLIHSGRTAQTEEERGVARPDEAGSELSGRLDHPYYWAPFILIGNGL